VPLWAKGRDEKYTDVDALLRKPRSNRGTRNCQGQPIFNSVAAYSLRRMSGLRILKDYPHRAVAGFLYTPDELQKLVLPRLRLHDVLRRYAIRKKRAIV